MLLALPHQQRIAPGTKFIDLLIDDAQMCINRRLQCGAVALRFKQQKLTNLLKGEAQRTSSPDQHQTTQILLRILAKAGRSALRAQEPKLLVEANRIDPHVCCFRELTNRKP